MSYLTDLMLSRFRRIVLFTMGAALAASLALFIWLGVLSGFATAYEVTLGDTSALTSELHGGMTARCVAVSLGLLGWIALPATVAVVLGMIVDRKLSVESSQMTLAEREELIEKLLEMREGK